MGILFEIKLNGDIADFYGVKLWPKLPHEMGLMPTIKDEIYLVNKFLDLLQDRYPGVKITFLEGNHEFRLARYICQKAPDLFDMFHIEDLLKLTSRGIPFVPYNKKNQRDHMEGTDVLVRHSPYSYGKNVAMANLNNKMRSVISGCSHRYQEVMLKDGDENILLSVSNGCMIDLKHEIFNYVPHEDWVNGFSIYYARDNGKYSHDFIHIEDGEAVALGNYYKSTRGFNLELY